MRYRQCKHEPRCAALNLLLLPGRGHDERARRASSLCATSRSRRPQGPLRDRRNPAARPSVADSRCMTGASAGEAANGAPENRDGGRDRATPEHSAPTSPRHGNGGGGSITTAFWTGSAAALGPLRSTKGRPTTSPARTRPGGCLGAVAPRSKRWKIGRRRSPSIANQDDGDDERATAATDETRPSQRIWGYETLTAPSPNSPASRAPRYGRGRSS